MEFRSHDRLEEVALSLDATDGPRRCPGEQEGGPEGGGASPEQQEPARSVTPGQGWAPGHGKAGERGASGDHQADMEDAHNLVAFSASVGSLPPSSSSGLQPHTVQLYDKFSQEKDSDGVGGRTPRGAVEGGSQAPEDLSTLQTALSQARHGHKPPNCDCEGPDCPDYLEWLEKKIQLAGRDGNGPCKMADAPHQMHSQKPHNQAHPDTQGHPNNQSHLHDQTQLHPQANGGNPHQQAPGSLPPALRPGPRPPPIPCSPQVLSIAKEKNVSLQTAIAIEALTQLSASGPQASAPSAQPAHHLHHHHHNHHGTHPSPSSPRSQSVPPGLQPSHQPWDKHRPQSQGQPPNASPLLPSPYPVAGRSPGPHLPAQQWLLQGQDQRNQWAMMASDHQPRFPPPPHGSMDPMSELKQLLGDTSRKFSNASFRSTGPHQHGPHPGLDRVKQEVDLGDYPTSACPSKSRYVLPNGQQQYPVHPPLSPNSAAIRFSTQAALQQHLHHKRNLFQGPGLPAQRGAQAGQSLRKWWPQTPGLLEGGPLLPPGAIKQEGKEPKRRKSTPGASPLVKQGGGGQAGIPVPKPKPIVIKKTKQKASLPTFLPQSQISIQKPSSQILPSPAPGNGPSLTLSHPPQAVPGLPTPAQSQVSIFPPTPLTAAQAASSAPPPAIPAPPPPQSLPPQTQASSEGDAPSTATPPQTSIPPSTTSQIPGLSSLDPKFEELIRQFEAEFGDETPASEPCPPLSHPPGQSPPSAQPGASLESQPGAHANSGPDRPASPPSARPAPLPPPAEQEMEVDHKPNQSGTPSEASPPDELREGTLPLALRQEAQVEQHPVKEEPFTVPLSPFPKRMKIEGSGGVTVLSTTCYSEDDTPTKEEFPCSPSLRGFLESPMRYLDTPTKSLLDTPAKDAQAEFPVCDCVEQILEKDEGPYYNHLGSGPTVASIRELMENRYGEKGPAIRIEKVLYTGREGKSSQGCPIAKWVIRRSGITEKLLCLVRHRAGHHCANAVIVILIMAWEGVPQALGDKLYRELSETLTKYGNPTSRRCGLNDDRTCACQGKDPDTCGASFSFGCSWSMYFNGCKYARSKIPRKFRLQGDRPEQEDKLRDNLQELATEVAPLYKQLAPKAYSNQCQNEDTASDCRLGLKDGRPFSGVTACMDFCAHAHKDQHNLYNGCTVVCTLTKEDNRKVGEIPEDEQLHVLPLYKVAHTDEFGSEENQRRKMQTGAIQMLNAFRREVRKLPERAKSCRQRRLEAKAKASEKKKGKVQGGETPGKTDVIRAELTLTGTPQTPLGNKAIPKQEVKPTIKKEVFIKKEPFNGALPDSYPGPEPYGVYPHPAHPAYYARGGLPPGGQPPAPGPVNGYHPNLPALPYGYFNYPPNALFPPELMSYDGRSGPWPKVGVKAEPLDHKPDVQGLQARLAHPYPSHPEPQHPAHQHVQSRPSSVSSESAHRVTPVIKPEPMDVPVYEGPGSSRTATPSSTPQPDAWSAHKPNGGILPGGWEGSGQMIPGPADSPFSQDRQQPSPYLQPLQWNSYPGPNTPMASPSPAMKAAPSPAPSPHPGTPRHWDSPAPSPQPKAWPPPPAYSPALKPGQPAGAFPDKMWSKAGESRSSTPLGVQEKAWRSCGGSAAGSTPSPAPEGRLFPDALQQTEAHACWDANRAESDAESVRGQDDDEVWSDSEHNFLDPNIGGVAVAPAHGSILLECARRELHATTPLKKPNRCHPTRISLVFYQHKNLNQPSHGLALWEAKMKLLAERARERQQEAALLGLSQEEIKAYGKKRKWGMAGAAAGASPGQAKDKKEGPATRSAPSLHTTSTVTSAPYACTQLTGPYSHFV